MAGTRVPRYATRHMATSSSSPRASAKLFHVLVAGGIAMAGTACSSTDPVVKTESDSGSAADGSSSDGSSSHDASSAADSGSNDASAAADACLNTPGDCTHGLCSW